MPNSSSKHAKQPRFSLLPLGEEWGRNQVSNVCMMEGSNRLTKDKQAVLVTEKIMSTTTQWVENRPSIGGKTERGCCLSSEGKMVAFNTPIKGYDEIECQVEETIILVNGMKKTKIRTLKGVHYIGLGIGRIWNGAQDFVFMYDKEKMINFSCRNNGRKSAFGMCETWVNKTKGDLPICIITLYSDKSRLFEAEKLAEKVPEATKREVDLFCKDRKEIKIELRDLIRVVE